MKKYLKFDRSKLIFKIILILAMFSLNIILFKDKLYILELENKTSILRIIFPLICMIIFSLSLFFKLNIKENSKRDFIISIIVSFIFMCYNFFIIQYGQGFSLLDIKWWWLFIANIATIGLVFMIIFSLTNSFKASIIGINFITLFFIFVEYFVFTLRGVGFAAGDLFSLNAAMNVANSYTYTLNYNVFISLILTITLSSLVLNLNKNSYFKGKKRIIPISLTILAIFIFIAGINNERVDRKLRVKYYKTQMTYKKKGFPICFVKSIKDLIVVKPDGYSAKNAKKVLSNYESDKKENKNGPNIIIVMDEAFTDFTSITDLKVNKDPIPFIHSLEENTIKGQLYTSVFGGGTSNTEFEVLTSNTMAFLPINVNPYRIYIKEKYPTINYTLKDQGYEKIFALHPYKGNGYSRNLVYPLIGFDKFITIDDFHNKPQLLGRYISDSANFDKIIETYKNYKKDTKAPFYMYNITMQNHSPFTIQGAKESIKLDYEQSYIEATQYINRLKYTDKAMKKLINYFKNVKEDTLIVFFGDHEPRLEKEFYEEVLKTYNQGKSYKELEKYNSQFFIWANYDIKEEKNIKISTNYLGNLIFKTAGLNQTGYDKYISNLREKIPVLTANGYIGDNGKFYEINSKKSPYYKLIKDYNIVQYNDLFDKKNRVESAYHLK